MTTLKCLAFLAVFISLEKGDLSVAATAFFAGLVACIFTPKPRQPVRFLVFGTIGCFVGFVVARASKADHDLRILIAMSVGLSANNLLDFCFNKAWENRATTINYTQHNTGNGMGNQGQEGGEAKNERR